MRRRRRGLTLIEAIAALVLLTIAVPPTLWAIGDAQVQRAGAVLATRARFLATEKLEDAIADRHDPNRLYAYVVNANYPAESAITGFPGFTRTVSVAETAANLSSAGTGYKTVTVTVGWTDPRRGARSLVIKTVVTDY